MISTYGLTHIHLVVRDLDRSLSFYTNVFGMNELFREEEEMVFLRTPGTQDMITFNADPKRGEPGTSGGISHFGFRLLDAAEMDRAVQEVEAAGESLLRTGEH